jgi:micrococcal nuclease
LKHVGTRSRQNLAALVFKKDFGGEWDTRDCHNRIVGKVWVQPPDCPSYGLTLDTGHAQIIVAWRGDIAHSP